MRDGTATGLKMVVTASPITESFVVSASANSLLGVLPLDNYVIPKDAPLGSEYPLLSTPRLGLVDGLLGGTIGGLLDGINPDKLIALQLASITSIRILTGSPHKETPNTTIELLRMPDSTIPTTLSNVTVLNLASVVNGILGKAHSDNYVGSMLVQEL